MRTLGIIGLGLIGGSCALAQRAYFERIIAFDPEPQTGVWAQQNGMIDATVDLATLAAVSDVVVLATPVGAMDSIIATLAPHLGAHTLLMDVGSTKQHMVTACQRHLSETQQSHCLPAHPIAGRELTGARAASADLFQQHWLIACPLPLTSAQTLQQGFDFWQRTGVKWYELEPLAHDKIFAAVSHLPHYLAYALMQQMLARSDSPLALQLAGTSLRELTRIASSSAQMWSDIARLNRDAIVQEIEQFETELSRLKQLILASDEPALLRYFESAKNGRDAWLARTA